MALNDLELRILGSLLEKERTTPEHYPLSSNALQAACNQKTNRDPVTNHGVLEIEDALRALADKGLTRTVRGAGERVAKHQHRLQDAFDLSPGGFAVLAVLMLRGAQTPGELRGRTERYVQFADVTQVEAVLERLADHQPPLARNLGRGPGQSQDRWDHTLGPDPEKLRPRVRTSDGERRAVANPHANSGSGEGSRYSEVEALKEEVRVLKRQMARVMEALGIQEE